MRPPSGGMRPPVLAEVVRAIASELTAAGISSAEDDARRLVAHALKLTPVRLVLDADRLASKGELAAIDGLVERRLAREPVTRIVGERCFWTGTFKVTPAVLDPRPDSETVVAAVLDHVRASGGHERPLRIADLGTGSGILLISLLSELPAATGIGIDISVAALEVARDNARSNGVASRARFVVSDWSAALAGPLDLIVANPPYIRSAEIAGLDPEVKSHDPRGALDGGVDGLGAYRQILADLDRIGPQAAVFFEIGYDQAADLCALAATGPTPRRLSRVHRDIGGRDRCVALIPQ